MAMIGHLPCFSNYLHDDFPLGNFYPTPSSVRRVKDLLSALVDSASPQDLKQNIGAHGIAPVRPDSREGKELINHVTERNHSIYCSWDHVVTHFHQAQREKNTATSDSYQRLS